MMKLKIWELSLFVALVIAVLWGVLLEQRKLGLSDQLIRLHVVAHSDEAADQSTKYEVRDRVYGLVLELLEDASTRAEAEARIAAYLTEIQEAAGAPVQVALTRERYPTRAYAGFTLPAGLYSSLRVEIGAAGGQNWWCVVFPPLCIEAARGPEALETMGLTEGEVALIASGDAGQQVRFRALELIDGLKAWLGL